MPAALAVSIRQRIITEKAKGSSLSAISEKYHLSYTTVCRIYQRYKQQGPQGLIPHYFHCGVKKTPARMVLFRRAALWLKRLHPQWGAGFIKVQLQQRYRAKLPCERTLQRWFQKAGLVPHKTRLPRKEAELAPKVHDIWQIDAKEKLQLRDAAKCCYLTVVDQKSGSLLNAFVFPPLPHQ